MSKGDLLKMEFKQYTDSYTGRIVTKLTSDNYLCHQPYFQNKMVTDDNRYLIFVSDADGLRNIYRMDLQNGYTVQLTEGVGIHDYTPALTSDDKYVLFSRGNSITRLHLDSFKEEIIYETPSDWSAGLFGMSSDDKYLVITEMNKKDMVPSTGDWKYFEPQWAKKPHCRIAYIDIDKKSRRIVYEDKNCWLQHAQLRPRDNNTILFCHEGPAHLIDARLWLIDADGTNLRCPKPKKHLDEIITHEYWLYDGSKFGFVYRPKKDSDISVIMFIDPKTHKEETLMQCSKYCHFISNRDNSKIVGDGQLEKEAFIFIVDVDKKKEEKLCWHGSSWKSYGNTQDAHPHPAFSTDGSMVIFTSDKDGLPGIYRVDL